MTDLPRDDLIRMSGRCEVREDGDGRTLHGYLAMFDSPTVINSWEGKFEETIKRGAFRKTIKESRDNIVPLFNHGFDPSIGDKPLGRFSVLREDDIGLYFEVPLSDTTYNADIAALVRDGAIPGNSFRFSVVKEEMTKPAGRGLPKRSLIEVKLREGGPVTFPAYQATTLGIRSREAFTAWRGADEQQRSQVCEILGISTQAMEAGPATSTDEPLPSSEEPAVTATPRTQSQRRMALLLRGLTPNESSERDSGASGGDPGGASSPS